MASDDDYRATHVGNALPIKERSLPMIDDRKIPALAGYATQREVAAEIGMCTRTLDRWRALGMGPPVTKLGRRILYRRSSLAAWLARQEQTTP